MKKNAFTLIELLTLVAIISALTAIVVPIVVVVKKDAIEERAESDRFAASVQKLKIKKIVKQLEKMELSSFMSSNFPPIFPINTNVQAEATK